MVAGGSAAVVAAAGTSLVSSSSRCPPAETHRSAAAAPARTTSMSHIGIRAARIDEIPALLAFWARSAEGTSITDDPDGVTRLLVRDPEALLVAERDGAIVGTVIAGYDGWRCHLYRLAVDPDQ